MEELKHFTELNALDVSKKTDKKGKFSYLSWAWAWTETKKRYPNATYEILKFNNLPYVFDPKTGYMVYTTVTIENITHEMWLPVMDFSNKAKLNANMMDVNKAIMRCLTKNLAMFGLGLYIYAGDDLPDASDDLPDASDDDVIEPEQKPFMDKTTLNELQTKINEAKTAVSLKGIYRDYNEKYQLNDTIVTQFSLRKQAIEQGNNQPLKHKWIGVDDAYEWFNKAYDYVLQEDDSTALFNWCRDNNHRIDALDALGAKKYRDIDTDKLPLEQLNDLITEKLGE